jgi:hypothetical protein
MTIAACSALYRFRWLITFLLFALVLVATATLVLGPIVSFGALHHGWLADMGRRTLSF